MEETECVMMGMLNPINLIAMLRVACARAGLFAGGKRRGRTPAKQPPNPPAKPPAPALRPRRDEEEEEGECDYEEPRCVRRPPAPAPAPAPRVARLPPRLAPLFDLCRPKEGGPAPARAASTAPRPALVHPTPARRQLAPIFARPAGAAAGEQAGKVAPVFDASARAAADKAAARWPGKRGLVPAAKRARPADGAASGKKPAREPVTNAVVVDRSTGAAYFVHEDGRRSPRQM
jgi:hypothetical protein